MLANSPKLQLLYPPLIPLAATALEEASMMANRFGFRAVLGHTYRDRAQQWKLYRKGRWQDDKGVWHRSLSEPIVTRAIPTKSAHCVEDDQGHACAMAFHIKILDDANHFAPDDHEVWACVGAAAFIAGGKERKLKWGGFWHSIRDCPHVEWFDWEKLVDSRGILIP